MGMDKLDQVFDIEEYLEPEHPLDPVIDLMRRQMDADRWMAQGTWYAYGRLANEQPVLSTSSGSDPEATAWGFGVLYQRMMLEFRDRKRPDTVGVAQAWEAYRATAGGSIDA